MSETAYTQVATSIEKGAIVPEETTKAEVWTKHALASVSVAHLQYAGDEENGFYQIEARQRIVTWNTGVAGCKISIVG